MKHHELIEQLMNVQNYEIVAIDAADPALAI